MRVVFDQAAELDRGLWSVRLRPTDAKRLEGAPLIHGSRSVVLAQSAEFTNGSLTAEMEALRSLVVGTSDRALVILSSLHDYEQGAAAAGAPDKPFDAIKFPGDADFLHEVGKLPVEAASAGRQLLELVRRKDPGSMKRGSRRNFSNSPDNFWYAVVQPSRGNLSITVRGRPEFFQPSTLELKVDRPGYTRFYLSKQTEVAEAFRIVSASRRRR
ncbi:MAG: hypothetical protein JNK30_01475 [Phenylobacterium sp.]|uniref:hypothetical protein n=1 Tax=Phenylobacterium sp. TaxID=1871053 RepID=UPI001A5E9A46|nr:hypothetical protein [Phenylobacterium sp.]MBL8770026.1 hypothetical protein [Phenylobacterium sp.]